MDNKLFYKFFAGCGGKGGGCYYFNQTFKIYILLLFLYLYQSKLK